MLLRDFQARDKKHGDMVYFSIVRTSPGYTAFAGPMKREFDSPHEADAWFCKKIEEFTGHQIGQMYSEDDIYICEFCLNEFGLEDLEERDGSLYCNKCFF